MILFVKKNQHLYNVLFVTEILKPLTKNGEAFCRSDFCKWKFIFQCHAFFSSGVRKGLKIQVTLPLEVKSKVSLCSWSPAMSTGVFSIYSPFVIFGFISRDHSLHFMQLFTRISMFSVFFQRLSITNTTDIIGQMFLDFYTR